MTARVCPVHGEYAADGRCRWCEPTPANTWEADHLGSTRCRCGKYAWAPGAAELNYVDPDRVAHSPEQCFKLDAEPPAVDAYADMLGPPPKPLPLLYTVTLRAWLRAPLSWRTEYADRASLVGLNTAEGSRLLAQHAALRWERVARRWATKHPSPWVKLGRSDLITEKFEKLLVDSFLRWIYGLESKP